MRDERPSRLIPELSIFGDDYMKVDPLQGGWQQAWVAGANDDPLIGAQALARATGSPVIAAFILDSDCGPVAGATPTGVSWAATLAKSIAIESYQMPDDSVSTDAAVEALHHWAEQAGLQVDHGLTYQALNEGATGPEHLFNLLLQALDIAPRQQSAED